MKKTVKKLFELIGETPLLEAVNFCERERLSARILVKLEGMNPAGSAKDRAALAMIEAAEREGKLQKGSVIVEPTSGNTGIGLASVAACKGYEVILTMPETMSVERRKLLKAYGAKLVLTDGSQGMQGAIDKAKELAENLPLSFLPGQFDNPENPRSHYETTGPEIWEQAGGKVDLFVAGVGTGGTLTGVGRYLKEKNPSIRVAAVEPAASPVLSKGRSGPHQIQGIGAGFVPKVLDQSIIDEVLAVSEEEAFRTGREFGRSEGFLIGISSGAALYGAVCLAKRPENYGKTIVAVLPDGGDRYLSTPMYED